MSLRCGSLGIVNTDAIPPCEELSELDTYQFLAARTRGTERANELAVLSLGVAGEASEVLDLFLAAALAKTSGGLADSLKKHLGHGHALDLNKLEKELGDVLWYVAMIAFTKGIKLSSVAQTNIEKLRARYPEGFSSKASVNRADP